MSWPWRDPVTLQDLPTSVYRAYDQDGQLLYVGITAREMRRFYEHERAGTWFPFATYLELEHWDNRIGAEQREKQLIRQYNPPYNIAHARGLRTVRPRQRTRRVYRRRRRWNRSNMKLLTWIIVAIVVWMATSGLLTLPAP